MEPNLTWEQAVEWLRQQPDQTALVQACYYDDPLLKAAQRFAGSEEWQASTCFFGASRGVALDLGAGRGIASYALASAGWDVVALEPDPSPLVGAGAIRALAADSALPIRVIEQCAEELPFERDTFDLIYGRQVLHHARDLDLLCREVMRVLKPGGRMLATREHVISQRADLERFLANHPLHRLYGGENAYLLAEYLSAFRQSGLRLRKAIPPLASPINYAPMTRAEWTDTCIGVLSRFIGEHLARRMLDRNDVLGKFLLRKISQSASWKDNTPGRLYSFVLEKTK